MKTYYIDNGKGPVYITRDVILKSYMVLLFEDRNHMRLLDDPQTIFFGDSTFIKVERVLSNFEITFSDGTVFTGTESQIRDFHFAMESLERSNVSPGKGIKVRGVNGGEVVIVEYIEPKKLPEPEMIK